MSSTLAVYLIDKGRRPNPTVSQETGLRILQVEGPCRNHCIKVIRYVYDVPIQSYDKTTLRVVLLIARSLTLKSSQTRSGVYLHHQRISYGVIPKTGTF